MIDLEPSWETLSNWSHSGLIHTVQVGSINRFPSFVDKHECNDGTHVCGDNARCENTAGGYECHCNPGFTGDGETCNGKHTSCIT